MFPVSAGSGTRYSGQLSVSWAGGVLQMDGAWKAMQNESSFSVKGSGIPPSPCLFAEKACAELGDP